MTIELSPELERIVQEAVISGHYPCAADVLAEAVAVWRNQRGNGALAAGEQRRDAIERLKTFGKTHGLSLGGLTIRELRDEARP
jgi:Arc/MetJ-type ribon-helix-helix transcriptional regulator